MVKKVNEALESNRKPHVLSVSFDIACRSDEYDYQAIQEIFDSADLRDELKARGMLMISDGPELGDLDGTYDLNDISDWLDEEGL